MLTRKQHELLMFIHRRIEETGVSPSFDEMKDALDLKSKSGIHRLITALEERGFIRRLAHRARALEVIDLPRNIMQKQNVSKPTLSVVKTPPPSPKHQGENFMSIGIPPTSTSIDDTEQIPVIGKIAAGTPIEALQQVTQKIGVPAVMLSAGAEHYALEVKGDSMIEAGIHDGDMVVIKRQETADNGDIVVALVDDQEATLKRLRRNSGSIALEPANAAYETQILGADRVKVQGRLVGLIRCY